jgi:ubiquinone biosynthesis protein
MMEAVKPAPNFKTEEAMPSSERQPQTNNKYEKKSPEAPYPSLFHRSVVYRLFILYKHGLGLLVGAYLAYVNTLISRKPRFFRYAGARSLAFLLRPFVKKELRNQPLEVQLRRRLEMLGPTYVKLGQIMAIREDILPEKITDELKRLLDRLPEVPFEWIQHIIEKSLRARLDELFFDIQKTPIGTASIAQTHLATAKTGEKIVIKVIKPGIREAILSDIKLLKISAVILEWLIPRYQPKMIINEFCAYTEKEVDLTYEADHAEIFAANFANQPDVVFPRIYRHLSSQDVLCMEYFDGLKPSDPQVLKSSSGDLQKIIDLGTGAIIKMLYADGFFHADLHAGNLLVLPGPQVGFIDVGMVGRFDEKLKFTMLYYFHALVSGDIDSSVQYLMAMARIGKRGDPASFKRAVSDLFRRYLLRAAAADGSVSLAQLILRSIALGGKYRVFFPVEMTLMIKALVTFEGVGLMLNPNLDIPALSRKHISAIFAEHYNPKLLFKQFMRGVPELVDVIVRLPEFISESSRYLQQIFNAPAPENPLSGLRSALMAGSCIIGGVIALVYGAHPILWIGLFVSSVIFFFFDK